ncbi:MAG: ketoacyl-ACP synthase III [Kiritimatiellaeota bacterium]|nr:ketoacyl-ACP synthase III [Kiritimatiellota bacterium]
MYVHIAGTGAALPKRVIRNAALGKILETTDDWIASHTGIRTRHIAKRSDTLSKLAAEAGRRALADAGVAPEALGMVVLATSSGDYAGFPATACIVQHALGAANAGAFDVNAACTGFIYALAAAEGFVRADGRPALVIGADMMSRIVDWSDRSLCVLFGDGAGAVALTASDEPGGIARKYLRADGSGERALFREGGTRTLDRALSPFVQMKGKVVFNFAVRAFEEVLTELARAEGVAPGDLARVIPHQANARIIEAAARRMNLPAGLFYMNIARVPNPPAATIPIALDELARGGGLRRGDLFGMAGFGAGLTYGGVLARWTRDFQQGEQKQ